MRSQQGCKKNTKNLGGNVAANPVDDIVDESGSEERSGYLTGRYWGYSVGLLTLVYAFNFVDRQIVNILAEYIKRDLGLRDWQLGVLTGFSFALVYGLVGIPVARLAERRHRPLIIAISAGVWSIFTAVCGFAGTFTQLAIARFGVGLGEAGATPASHSLIVNYTPPEKRGRALSLYQTGVPLGGLIGMALGGIVADLYGWRAAFFIAGAPGIIIAVVVALTLVEPRKTAPQAARPQASFKRDAAFLLAKRAFPLFAVGGSLIALRGYGTQAFIASFFFRIHGGEIQAYADRINQAFGTHLGQAGLIGIFLGLLGGIASILGTIIGGFLMDHWSRKNVRHLSAVTAIPQLIAAPFLVVGLLWHGALGAFILMTLPTFFSAMSIGPVWAGIQSLATPATRATATAVAALATAFIGLGLGPLLVGVISDLLAAAGLTTGDSLRWALIAAETPALVGAAMMWAARGHLEREVETARA
ncbi:MAG: major facilitator family transporter protein [Caulobacteraceae bacterium]|nr:major facilitator family transporter protein [Caulobacteraceae bacterium]